MKKLACAVVTSVMVLGTLLTACAQTSPATTTTPPATSSPAVTKSGPTITPTATATQPTPTPTAATPKKGGILKIGYASGPASSIGLPMEAIGVTTRAQQLTMEALFYEDLDGSFHPRLGLSQEQSPDGSVMTIKLRKGVKFIDGTDFNAQAVLWNFNKLKEMGALNSVSDTWKQLDVIDDYTFKITYKHWQNVYLRDLAEPTNFMISPTAFDTKGLAWARDNMVGTGAFMQKSFQRDVAFKAVRNPNYWDAPKPYLDEIDEIYIPDALTRIAALQTGEVDVLQEGDPKIISDMKAQNRPVNFINSGSGVLTPDSGNATSPWANLNVRLAAEYAIDKDAIAKALGYGFRTPTYQIPTPGNAVFNPALPKRTYDLAKAQQLMKDAGMTSGFETRLIVAVGQNQDYVLAVQNALSKINIKATIENPTGAKFAEYQTQGWTNGLLVTGMGEWPNYNADWGYWFARNSNWWPSVQKSDELVGLMTKSSDSVKPDVKLMQDAIKNIYDTQLVVPTLYTVSAFIYNGPYIHDTGFLTRMFNIHWRPENAWVDAH